MGRRLRLPTASLDRRSLRPLLAAALGLAASLAAALAARAWLPGPDPEIVWFGYEVHDRRWLLLGYGLGVASLVLVPLLAVRARAWWSHSPAGAGDSDRAAFVRVLAALAVYALWLGPPWNLAQLARPMEWHELAHLGPLQALLAGKDFYLESGTQYGPGMQMLSLLYLEHFGVSLERFREFWLWTNFVGGAVLVAWLAWLFPVLALVAGMLVLRFFSPFSFLWPAAGGSYEFFFGWATCIRYAGGVHAVLAIAAVIARAPPRGAPLSAREALFLGGCGFVWCWLALIAQENLGCGVAGAGLFAAFALITRAAPLARLGAIGAAFGAGALLAAAPVIALFAAAGELGAFALRYFEVGGYVVAGFSSMPFDGSFLSPVGILYLALPIAAAALFAVAAFDGHRARHWRVTAAAAAAAALAGHAPALLRSEASHVLAMLTPLAFLAAAALAGLRRADFRLASWPVLVLVLLPVLAALRPEQIGRLAGDVAGRVRAFAARSAPVAPIGGRVGYRYDLAAPYAVFSALPLGEFLDVTARLREKVGTRPVVVASAIGSRGHWYFFADLVPAPSDPEPSQTIHNNRLRARYLAELDARGIPCVISMRPEMPKWSCSGASRASATNGSSRRARAISSSAACAHQPSRALLSPRRRRARAARRDPRSRDRDAGLRGRPARRARR